MVHSVELKLYMHTKYINVNGMVLGSATVVTTESMIL